MKCCTLGCYSFWNSAHWLTSDRKATLVILATTRWMTKVTFLRHHLSPICLNRPGPASEAAVSPAAPIGNSHAEVTSHLMPLWLNLLPVELAASRNPIWSELLGGSIVKQYWQSRQNCQPINASKRPLLALAIDGPIIKRIWISTFRGVFFGDGTEFSATSEDRGINWDFDQRTKEEGVLAAPSCTTCWGQISDYHNSWTNRVLIKFQN